MYDIIVILWYNVITYEMQVQGRKIYAGTANSTAYHHFTGMECLDSDMHLLKPASLDVPPVQLNVVCADDMQPEPAWLKYLFWKSHQILHWLHSKLAVWISENHGSGLGIPPKSSLKWRAGELNAILENNLVPSQGGKQQLWNFCCIQWECELSAQGPRQNTIPSHCYRGKKSQVLVFPVI